MVEETVRGQIQISNSRLLKTVDLPGADTASLQAGPEQKRQLYSLAGKRFQNHLIVERVHSLVRLPVDKQQGLETTVEPLPRLAEVEDSHDLAPLPFLRNRSIRLQPQIAVTPDKEFSLPDQFPAGQAPRIPGQNLIGLTAGVSGDKGEYFHGLLISPAPYFLRING